MVAITMLLITSILNNLKKDFPDLTFKESPEFKWQPKTKTIHYQKSGDLALLFHELAHAKLHHTTYLFDIELLRIESEAWQEAASLSLSYGLKIKIISIKIFP